MKKSIATIMAVVVLTVSGLALAQMNDKGKEMMKDGMMGKGMMGGGMMGMCPMMQSMMQKSVVATSDGGVIVVAGNKLTKYDKDLNLVKEVELKTDMEGMQKMMNMMKSMCPMMGDPKEDSTKSNDAAGEAASADDHDSHHPAE